MIKVTTLRGVLSCAHRVQPGRDLRPPRILGPVQTLARRLSARTLQP